MIVIKKLHTQNVYLDKTLKCVHGVWIDNRKVFFVHQVLGSNFLSAFFLSFNIQYIPCYFEFSLEFLRFTVNVKEFANKIMNFKLMFIKLILEIEKAREHKVVSSFLKCTASLRYMHGKVLLNLNLIYLFLFKLFL